MPVDVDRVPGIVAALIPRHGAEVRREHVDDLALALVAPLRAQHSDVCLRHSGIFESTMQIEITTHRGPEATELRNSSVLGVSGPRCVVIPCHR